MNQKLTKEEVRMLSKIYILQDAFNDEEIPIEMIAEENQVIMSNLKRKGYIIETKKGWIKTL